MASDDRTSSGTAPRAAPLRPNYPLLAALFIASRAFIALVAGIALAVAPKAPNFTPPRSALDWFMRWDAQWYLDVLQNGYYFHGVGQPTDVVFFPFFPWLARALTLGGTIDGRVAAYAVASAGLWLACVLLWRMVAESRGSTAPANWSVAFLLFGPVSFFFSIPYSESWFLALSLAAVCAAQRERWWLAGLAGALAALTRFIGIVVIVPLAWLWLEQLRKRPPAALAARRLVAVAGPLWGFGLYCAFMAARFGDPLLYFHAQANWGRHFVWFWALFASPSFWGLAVAYRAWFAASVIVAFALLLLGARFRLPTAWQWYALVLCFIYVSSRGVEALPRYFSVVFPLYAAAGILSARRKAIGAAALVGSAALLAVSVSAFVCGYWFT